MYRKAALGRPWAPRRNSALETPYMGAGDRDTGAENRVASGRGVDHRQQYPVIGWPDLVQDTPNDWHWLDHDTAWMCCGLDRGHDGATRGQDEQDITNFRQCYSHPPALERAAPIEGAHPLLETSEGQRLGRFHGSQQQLRVHQAQSAVLPLAKQMNCLVTVANHRRSGSRSIVKVSA
jgi:hypothetical protein